MAERGKQKFSSFFIFIYSHFVFDSIFEIQKNLSIQNDYFFLNSAVKKIFETYLPVILRLLHKNCRLLNLKCDDLLTRSWIEETNQELEKAFRSYHAQQHYLSNRNLHFYLLTALSNFTKQKFWSQSGKQKYFALICPACRLENEKNLLVAEDRLWRCHSCTEKINSSLSLPEKNFHLVFSLHSKSGFLCPDCCNFIPSSVEKNGILICPFPKCCFSGSSKKTLRTTHPVTIRFRDSHFSIDNGPGDSRKEVGQEKYLKDPESSLSEDSVLLKDISEKEFKLLQETIRTAMSFNERQALPATKVQKTLFYRAFWDLTEKYPEEMVSYLVHNKTSFDFGLQAKIFQIFLFHLENFLPYSFVSSTGKTEICSLFDSRLGLFDGESNFTAIVQSDYSIPNLTSEHYFSQNLKDYGPYFLGKIVELKNEAGQDLLPEMQGNSFVKIELTKKVLPGTKVFVRHYRLVPHYTMGILIHLQKIRKHLGEILARKKKNWK